MAALSTIALTSLAAAGVGASVYQGEQQRNAMQSAQRRQRETQAEALRLQMVQRQRAVQADMERAARPSLASPLDAMPASTDRTAGGLFEDRLRLARRTTLGGL